MSFWELVLPKDLNRFVFSPLYTDFRWWDILVLDTEAGYTWNTECGFFDLVMLGDSLGTFTV